LAAAVGQLGRTAETGGRSDSLRRLGAFLLPLRFKLAAAAVCIIGASLMLLCYGKLFEHMMNAIVTHDRTALDRFALIWIAVFGTKALFTFGQAYFLANAVQRLSMRLRNMLYEHLQGLSIAFFDRQRIGQLMATITNDVPALQSGLAQSFADGFSAPFVVVGGTAYLFYQNWRLAFVALVILPLMAFSIMRAGRRMRGFSAQTQRSLGDLSALLEETIAGVRIVQSFVRETYEQRRFRERSWETFRAEMRAVRLRAVVAPLLEVLGAASLVLVLWFGAREMIGNPLGLGSLSGFVLVVQIVARDARDLGRIHLFLQQARAASDRIFALLDTRAEICDRPSARDLPRLDGEVRFEGVTFRYGEGPPVLEAVSFALRPGEVGALVGPSGAGKSTIANLIPRFYDVTAGTVRVDGRDTREVTLASLRRQVAIVPQETLLFGGTVRENIAYGRIDATAEEIEDAARAANAHEFIDRLPSAYDTVVGERGVKLSGGQRQRIAIARAILKDARILILDEATSSLDAQSEVLVQEALERLMVGRTTLVIAHRLSTIRNADQILVIDGGRIVEAGRHEELLNRGGLFAHLYQTQLAT
jgi:ATP-binding cassette, subfamily B, bacterial MsbA